MSRFLRMAVVAGVESAVQIHINRGDDLNARDEKGQTPLMLSAAHNKPGICKLLLAAGANPSLLNASGLDALSIAQVAGAIEAASVIEAICQPQQSIANMDIRHGEPTRSINSPSTISLVDNELNKVPSPSTNEALETTAPEPEIAQAVVEDASEFDLGKWEAEEDQAPPEGEQILTVTALKIQTVLSEHQPIDTSADWDDFKVFLPDRATPLPREGDAEARERLRLVLLRAIREGSIPHAVIDILTHSDNGDFDVDTVALLRMVINDLGAEIDERVEYSTPYENFEVFVEPNEKSDEEETLAEALTFIDDLGARHNDPLFLYLKELQRETLLSAETEVALSQAMECSVEQALDALAAWPAGVVVTVNAALQVAKGNTPLRAMSSGPQADLQDDQPAPISSAENHADPALEPSSAEGDSTGTEDESDSEFDVNAKASTDELALFRANAEFLSGLSVGISQNTPEWKICRGVLASLGLTRGFLMKLTESGLVSQSDSAIAFRQAMQNYLRARDRMVMANLRLVYSISKKYLFSGQPIDDLQQEGNIGLLKAVDRYDWRKGFKFSTYATWWIRQQVGRFVADKGKIIRLPVHIHEKTQRIAQAARTFEFRHGLAPTMAEVAMLVELPIQTVETLYCISQDPLPLHELSDIDDLIAPHARDQFATDDPVTIVEDIQLGKSVDCFLSTLKPKEASVVRMRYGIGGQEAMTLEEIGTRFDVTRERIRQIEAKALRKLRHPAQRDKLSTELGLAMAPKPAQNSNKPGDALEKAATRLKKPLAPVVPRPTQHAGSESSALDKLLDQAREAGIVVEDYLEGYTRRLWVHITNTPDDSSCQIAQQLIELEFKFWPGKGYWR